MECVLVIEVDGEIHLLPEQVEYDKVRTKALEQRGLKVLRFTNNEVLHKLDEVLNEIARHLIPTFPTKEVF